ncbi:glycosyltransferase family 2 protein [Phycisphaerales bacterium AB-hyl4]|uniref:Glycosyltransferase family 2 protein n=1 Tax=Natronomicrosphaera hydrolytica TaxID=3242702 RepID=A0ABV4U1Z6_9BACT
MDYEIVIATRNRTSALELSLPLMLRQQRLPKGIFIVDSSDDHKATAEVVDRICTDSPVPVTLEQAPRGLTLQRNIGLSRVNSPVVMFPDDDALWSPDVADRMMNVYERDKDERISAVCAAPAAVPPAGVLSGSAAGGYRMSFGARVRQWVAHPRTALERRLCADPFVVHGRSMWNARDLPDWFAEDDVVPVEYMTGYRMSFRTSVAKQVGFDEHLADYALNEDVDASFGAWRHGIVAGARQARVYHYQAPGKRASGRQLGVMEVLNRAYVVCKHAPLDAPARRTLKRFSRYKLLGYLGGVRSTFGRERVIGVRIAIAQLPKLLAASADELPQAYRTAWAACLGSQAAPTCPESRRAALTPTSQN